MGYKNPYALANEALGCGDCYNIGSHGCCSATYDSLINADLPQYTARFYSPTQHEALNEIRYSRTEIGYDDHLREIKQILEGAPIEAYIPHHAMMDTGGSALPKVVEHPIIVREPPKNVIQEIAEAQKQIMGKEIILKEVTIEELVVRRRIRKREIRIR